MENSDIYNKTDIELVSLTKKDPAVFGIIMERYESRFMAYIKRISAVTNEEAEDILQDSFLKAYQNLNSFDDKLAFSSWMYRIVHNETISAWRKNKSRPQGNSIQVDDEFFERVIDSHDVIKNIDDEFMIDKMKDVFIQMDDKYREVLVLKFIEDKSYDEISDILKKPPGTVATHINRAKKQFKTLCEKSDINFLIQ
ncbi:MAG: RNA polymerase sigma factor [Candidatus Moraniibacteriota bacterium]|jgi:RNA polymerase sigma-70 factor, ECF subfamily